jgi:hypothetical protein
MEEVPHNYCFARDKCIVPFGIVAFGDYYVIHIKWRYDTRHNDTQNNKTQHNDTQHNDIQHNS